MKHHKFHKGTVVTITGRVRVKSAAFFQNRSDPNSQSDDWKDTIKLIGSFGVVDSSNLVYGQVPVYLLGPEEIVNFFPDELRIVWPKKPWWRFW